MSLAPQEMKIALASIQPEAIRLDSQGSRGMAINSYQRAIEALVKLVQIYPDYKLNKVYMERANAYQNRIKALQMSQGQKKRNWHQLKLIILNKILQMGMEASVLLRLLLLLLLQPSLAET